MPLERAKVEFLGTGLQGVGCLMRDGIKEVPCRVSLEEAMLAYEVSDEALETAAGAGSKKAGNYTLYYCTALHLCPGP
jgi:hypothetical protein